MVSLTISYLRFETYCLRHSIIYKLLNALSCRDDSLCTLYSMRYRTATVKVITPTATSVVIVVIDYKTTTSPPWSSNPVKDSLSFCDELFKNALLGICHGICIIELPGFIVALFQLHEHSKEH